MRIVILSILLATVCAFQAPYPASVSSSRGRHPPHYMSSTTEEEVVPIVVEGQNVELTPALTDYVTKRIGGHLNKLFSTNGAVRECDVILSVSKNPKVRVATVVASL